MSKSHKTINKQSTFKRSMAQLAAVLVCTAGVWTVAQAQSLTTAAQDVLRDYPGIKAARSGHDAANAEVDRAKGTYMPQVSINASTNKIHNSDADQDLLVTPVVTWSVPINGRVRAEVERANSAAQAAQARIDSVRNDVALQLSEAWIAVVRGQHLTALSQANVKDHETILGDIRKIVAIDAGRQIDLTQAQVRLDAAKSTLIQRQAELALAKQKLARFIQATPAEAAFAQYPTLGTALPATLAEAKTQASNPDVARARAQAEEAQHRLESSQRLRYATLDLTMSRQALGAVTGNKVVVAANFNVPLYQGGQIDAGIRRAAADALAAKDSVTESELIIHERLGLAYAEMAAATQRIELTAQQRDNAARLVRGYTEQFRMGRRTLLDLLNIQSEFSAYQQAQAQAQHDLVIAQFRASAAMGKLANSLAPL